VKVGALTSRADEKETWFTSGINYDRLSVQIRSYLQTYLSMAYVCVTGRCALRREDSSQCTLIISNILLRPH